MFSRRLRGLWNHGAAAGLQGERTVRAKVVGDYIQEIIHDRPELVLKVTPHYPSFPANVSMIADDFYRIIETRQRRAAFQKRSGGSPHTAVASRPDGVESERLDILGLVHRFFSRLIFLPTWMCKVERANLFTTPANKTPGAVMGFAVAGFPNFYMRYGTDYSNGGEILFHEEQRFGYIMRGNQTHDVRGSDVNRAQTKRGGQIQLLAAEDDCQTHLSVDAPSDTSMSYYRLPIRHHSDSLESRHYLILAAEQNIRAICIQRPPTYDTARSGAGIQNIMSRAGQR